MSTLTAEPTTFDLTQLPRTPFARIVRVELRKCYDTRAGWWLLASMGLITIAIYLVMLLMVAVGTSDFSYSQYVNGAAVATSLLLPILGILLVTSEWSQRTAMTTFSLEPRRYRVIAAKLATGLLLAVIVASFALAAGAAATLLNAAMTGTAGWDVGASLLAGFLLTQAIAMLGGFALATLLLNSPAAIVVFFLYKWAVPAVLMTLAVNVHGFRGIQQWIDFQNAQESLRDLTIHGSQWAHLLITGTIWLALPLWLGLRRVLHAEVK